jgi:hypothetical protein
MLVFKAVCAGLGLAAACGLRVFLPLFAVSVAMKWGFMSGSSPYVASPAFEWMGSNAAVAIFCIAAIIESFGYLFRWVDLILDLLAAPLAAFAGALLMTSQLTALVDASASGDAARTLQPLMHPAIAWSVGIAAGVLVASGVEAASIFGRLTSSVLTIGWLNPIYGLAESVLATGVAVLTLLVPELVGIVVILFVPMILLAAWRFWVWRRRQQRMREDKMRQVRERIANASRAHEHRTARDRPA